MLPKTTRTLAAGSETLVVVVVVVVVGTGVHWLAVAERDQRRLRIYIYIYDDNTGRRQTVQVRSLTNGGIVQFAGLDRPQRIAPRNESAVHELWRPLILRWIKQDRNRALLYFDLDIKALFNRQKLDFGYRSNFRFYLVIIIQNN